MGRGLVQRERLSTRSPGAGQGSFRVQGTQCEDRQARGLPPRNRGGLHSEGSVFLVESLDRICTGADRHGDGDRQEILRARITIVTRSPRETFRPEDVNDLGKTILLAAWAYRAHEECKPKGERVAKESRGSRRLHEIKMTAKGPAWLRLSADRKRFIPIPEKVAVVRKVFRLAAEGYGVQRLARKLSEDGVPSLTGIPWSRSGLVFLLRSKAVLGEFQPCIGYGSRSDRKPVGEPIQGYYPAVIDEELFYRVQAEFAKRAFGRPKKGKTDTRDNGSTVEVGDEVSESLLRPLHRRSRRLPLQPRLQRQREAIRQLRGITEAEGDGIRQPSIPRFRDGLPHLDEGTSGQGRAPVGFRIGATRRVGRREGSPACRNQRQDCQAQGEDSGNGRRSRRYPICW